MKVVRLLLLVVLFSALAGVAAKTAGALGFEDEPCPLTDPVNHQLKVCHPDAEVGKPYSLQIKGKGGCTPDFVRYDVVSGTLPPGLSVSAGDALVSGIPTQAGVFTFFLQVSDLRQSWCVDDKQSQWEFQITVDPGMQIVQRQPSLTPGQVGTSYTQQFTATGGNATWSSSGTLPTGLTLNGSTGLLSGTPTATGDFSFKVTASDGSRSDTQSYGMSVVDPLKIAAATAPAAEVQQPFTLTLAATGGKPGYQWSVATDSPLPAGLTLDAAKGTIAGTPTIPGTSVVKLTATDTLGLTSTVDVKIAVAPKVTIVSRPLPSAKVGRVYRARLLAVGGVAPKRWTIVRGSLPRGVRLNAATGALSGKPLRKGTSRVTFQVTDSLSGASKTTFVL